MNVAAAVSPAFVQFAVAAKAHNLLMAVVTFADSNTIPDHLQKKATGGEDLVRYTFEAAQIASTLDCVCAYYPKWVIVVLSHTSLV